MKNLSGKKILLIICGGIAAYKSLELIRILKKQNCHIQVVITESAQDFIDQTTNDNGQRDLREQYSDGALHILNSNYNDIAVVKFKDLFPIYLTSLEFDATESDVNYFTADITFKYTIYDILSPTGKPL